MIEIYKAFSGIIENPFVKKTYNDLEFILRKLGRVDEANAINYLIKEKFYEPNRSAIEDSTADSKDN